METAGRAVVFSGTTVAVGLLALVVLPLPFLRSMGYGGMLIPLVATSVAITLLPVILATVGPRMDWPHGCAGATRATRSGSAGRRPSCAAAGSPPSSRWPILVRARGRGDEPAPRQRRPRHDREVRPGQARASTRSTAPASARARSFPSRRSSPRPTRPRVAAAQARVDGVHGAVAPAGRDWRRDGTRDRRRGPAQGDEPQAGRDAVAGPARRRARRRGPRRASAAAAR